MLSLKGKLAKYYINSRGWKTNRKIVVIESDDWGSIRMPSKDVVELLNSKKYPLENNKFTLLDGLERKDDLEQLFKVLESFVDKNGNNPVITACAVVANPDFKKIKESNFTEYYYNTIEETYHSYGENDLLELWRNKGIKKNLLYPQFHGREHLNPMRWLKVLRTDNAMEREAFDNKVLLGLSGGCTPKDELYMSSFYAVSPEEKIAVTNIAEDGLKLFERIFGFKSLSVAPPQSVQFLELNKFLIGSGVLFNQAGQFLIPQENGTFKKVNKFWGEKDAFGMKYWRRNCRFEPFQGSADPVAACFEEIEIAFACKKPAVISSHRINFTSRITKDIRDLSLDQLGTLFSKILKKYPEVEFLNSEQLAKMFQE